MNKYIKSKLSGVSGLLTLGMVTVALVAVACGSDDSAAPTQPSAPAQPASERDTKRAALGGTIEIDGSSTVFPITEAVAEEFRKVAPDVRVNVGVSGSGGGFKRFTVGETDISDASRPIKDSEATVAEENGIEYFEFLVGVDGLSVMVSPNNDFVECMTVEQLNSLWNPESSVYSWNDLDPSWPDRRVNLYGPGTDSGTFDYFTYEINGESASPAPTTPRPRTTTYLCRA